MLRLLVAVLGTALAGPPLVVGLTGLGLPWPAATMAVAAAAGTTVWRRRGATGEIVRAIRRQPALILLVVALGAAAYYNVRLSSFMFDGTDASASVFPSRRFFRQHTCLSSYTEAARLAQTGVNIFEMQRYVDEPRPGEFKERFIGPFEVDIYQYPPSFLIVPHVAVAAGMDFPDIRRLWFAVQALLLFAGMAGLASWIGGTPGIVLLALTPVVWLAPTTRVGLQIGNFQLTAFPLAVLAMVAFDRSRAAAGGLALGFVTVSKIFPGVLGLLLLAQRRWSAIGWCIFWSVVVTALAWLAVGSAPFVDFVRYQLPRIESGEAFFWIEFPSFAPLNQSIYGLVTKLRSLGVPGMGAGTANAASSIYALLLLPLVAWGALRLRAIDAAVTDIGQRRLRHAQVWLGLLSLASFRSPFVPDAYGLVGTLWLLTLIAVERARSAAWLVAIGFAAIAFAITLDGGVLGDSPPIWSVAATLAIQLAAVAFNLYGFVAEPAAVVESVQRRQPARMIGSDPLSSPDGRVGPGGGRVFLSPAEL
jgi:hypothetical protein